MVTKMTKYSIILLTGEMNGFLSRLQELGMMDITRSEKSVDEESKKMSDIIARCKNAIQSLNTFAKEHPDTKAEDDGTRAEKLLEKVEANLARMAEIRTSLTALEKEYTDSLPWGDFDHADVDRLKAAGLTPHFYCVPNKQYEKSWEEEYPIGILNNYGGNTYFTVIATDGEDFTFPVQNEVKLPVNTASKVEAQMNILKAENLKIEAITAGYAKRTADLQEVSDRELSDLDLYLAGQSSVKEGEGSISVLEGFAQTSDDAKMKEFLDASDAYYLAEAAKGEDNPPIKLRNNWFARLFEPIGSLYELPNYDEVDLTPYFAPFYMLFFGFCLGDMGYGLILLVVGIVVALTMPKYSAYGKLIAWLGIGSIIMPLISGTFFGMKIYDIIPMSESIESLFFSDLKMFWFSIIFGLFQIVFARMIKAIIALSKKKWDEGLTEIGWSMIIVWAACAYAGSQMDKTLLPVWLSRILSIGGLVLILFCSSPSKHFFLRPIKGLVSLYDITSIFGDMLSYIRLFGLGTTGGILALVINSIAMSLSGIPYVGWVLTVLFLIVGHLAVMGLSCLGAFVHPVRLTFVEFYKNVGFVGGGRAFRPLKSYINNK